MNASPKARTTTPWRTLQENLTDSFIARARGFLGDEFALSNKDGEELGRLKILGSEGAKFTASGLEVTVGRISGSRYTMLSDGEEVLSVQPANASVEELEIRCGGRDYTATVSLFRNRAVVRDESGMEVARLKGNVTGRTYRIETATEEPCVLPLAVLLLYHTAFHRRRAYRALGER